MQRLPQVILIICLLLASWLGMQIVHEFGHVLGAWWTGGVIGNVVLRPWTISRTELTTNPDPLLVAWAGPVFGATIPLLMWLTARATRCPSDYLLRFFAGFCLIANGAYLGGGALDRLADAGDIQRHGSPLWLLYLFAAATVPGGMWLWHRQGRHFGFGGTGGRVKPRDLATCITALGVVVALQFLFGSA